MKRVIILILALSLSTLGLAINKDKDDKGKAAAEKIVRGPVVEGVGDSWAVIAWTTNTGGGSVVKYGTDPKNLSATAESPYADNDKTAHQVHRVKLNGLRPGTTYFYEAVSAHGEGTGTQALSGVEKFTTKGAGQSKDNDHDADDASHKDADDARHKSAAVKITGGPVVEGVGKDFAVIAWTTNTGGSTLVHYGTDPNHLDQTGEARYADNEKTQAQNHRVHLKNLKPNTTYYFVADSGQGEGTGTEAKSSVGQFKTK